MADCILEVCVDSAFSLEEAIAGGADRIELCSSLGLGGLSPLPGMMALAASSPIPVYALIRPRSGDFVFSQTEVAMMKADIDLARQHGLAGVVIGASCGDGTLDRQVLAALVEHAKGLGLTLHRAFDLVPDFNDAIDMAAELGFERILTSGGARSAMDGIDTLAAIVAHADSRLSIMPGSGVNTDNAGALIERLGVHEVHSSASAAQKAPSGKVVELGFESAAPRATSRAVVAAIKSAISAA